MKNYTSTTIFTIVLILLLGKSAFAVTKTTTQSGNWSSSSTWGGTSAPVSGDNVIINGGFTVTVDVPNASCASIQLGGSSLGTGAGTLSFTNGSQVIIAGALSIGPFNDNNTTGSLNMTNGGTLTCESIIEGRLGTWTEGTGTIELTATNTIPKDNKVIFNNLTLSGGTTSLPGNIVVNANILINVGATLDGGANTLSVGGNWTNNGTFTGNTGTVIFDRNGNQTISGTGLNNFNLLKVNLGTSISNTLEVTATNFNAPDAFLTLTNGTFKVSGTFTFTNTFFTGPSYNIQPSTGLWINNPNVTITSQTGGVSVRGLLRLSAGKINIGTTIDNSLDYVTGSTFIVEGGSMEIAGRLTRNNATASTSYTQTGGTVTVVGQGSTDPTFAGFDLGAVGSSFTISGGTIVIRNATSAPVDYLNASSVANITGGTLQAGDAGTTNALPIRIQGSHPIGNLLVYNATAKLVTSSLNVINSITIQAASTLDANGLNISLGGDWTNNGVFIAGGNTVTFNGSIHQSLSNPNGETFNNLTINKTGSTLTMKNSVNVVNAFNMTQGTIEVGGNTLTLNGSVNGSGILTSDINGTVNYNQGSAGQSVLASNYGNLIFSDFNKTLASTGIIGISGTFTPGAATGHILTGSTLDFNGGSQNIPAFTYNNVITSGSGIKTGSGIITVAGNLTNNSGIEFSGASALNLNGTTHINSGTLGASTLSVGTGATLTNNGTLTVSSSLTGAGTINQGATAVLNIGGTSSIASLNASASGNTVNYTGTGQTVMPVIYHHLLLSGSGTPILTGVSTINGNFVLSGSVTPTAATGMTILGDFTIGTGTTFNAGSFSHTLKGNWNNSGTFIAGTSTFTLNGTNTQTINGATFNNLSIANATGVTMSADVTINGTLSLASGSFDIGAHTLNLNGLISNGSGSLIGGPTSNMSFGGAGASTSLPGITLGNLSLKRVNGITIGGDITVNTSLNITNGILNTGINKVILGSSATLSETAGQLILGTVTTTRNITASSGTELFGNIGSDIILNGKAPGNTTVLRKTGLVSVGNGHSSIKRYFDITPTTNTGLNAGLVFHYDPSELNNQNGDILELFKSTNNGSTWNNQGGIASTSPGKITITGVNDFSRWTAADTNNSLGNTVTPVITIVSPTSKFVGDPGFTLVVTGSDFVNGKSIVQFNGLNRSTAYINSTQLSATIPASDLLVVGSFQVKVFNSSGGGLSNTLSFIVDPLPPVKILVETAADGSGTIVSSQSIASGATLKVYAIARDVLNNFVSNIAASSWILENISGGVVSGDLVPAIDSKSALFTGHVIGTSDIKATFGILTPTPSGIITIVPGAAAKVIVETAADGTGTVIPTQSLTTGTSLTVYAIARDASNNFVANVGADVWSLQNVAGNLVPGNLVPAADSKSAVFMSHSEGSATISATSGLLSATVSGMITVFSAAGIEEGNKALTYALMQNYPNPFNQSTTINYQVPTRSHVIIKVFDMNGVEVTTLVNQTEEPGQGTISFDAGSLSSGTYFYRLQAGKYVETRKFLLLK